MLVVLWVIAAVMLALWSLLAWGMHGLLAAGPGWLGELDGLIARIPFGDRLDRWWPGWRELAHLALDLTGQVLEWLGTAAPWIAWVVWALGTLFIVALAAVLALMIALVRRRARSG